MPPTPAPNRSSLTSGARRPRRLLFLAVVLCLPLLAQGAMAIWFPELDTNIRVWLTLIAAVLGLLLGLLWLALLSGVGWRWRIWGVGLAAAAFLAAKHALKKDGPSSGVGFPRLTWVWSKTRVERLAGAAAPAASTAAPVVAPTAHDFPQFLGPDRRNAVAGALLDKDWANHPPRLLWRQPIGFGWSGFSVVGQLAVTQEQRGADELVTAYDVRSGGLVWAHTNHVRFEEWQGGPGPRSTPTIEGGRVYTCGATGILDCLELPTGRLVWSHDVLREIGGHNSTWGKSCSPLVADGLAVVTGSIPEATLVAYHSAEGSLAWKTGVSGPSYASPSITTLRGLRQVLSMNEDGVQGYDPATGRVLWSFTWPGPGNKYPKAAQPLVVGDDQVFLSAGYGAGCILLKLDKGVDGSLSATEVWRSKSLKAQFNNVSIREGYFYGLDDGFMACVEIATGRRVWKDGRFGNGQTLLVDDVIVAQAEPGAVVLVDASPSGYRELGRLEALSSKTWNNPTVASPYLLVRNDEEAACYRLPVLTKPLAPQAATSR